MKTTEVSNGQSVIDSRDIISRIDELESMFSELLEKHGGEASKVIEDEKESAVEAFGTLEELEELNTLQSLAEDAGNRTSDFEHGEALIRRSYWVEYVEEMLKDIGDLPKDIPWYVEIDWDKTADNIESDYSTVDFGGVEYLIRNS